MFINFKVFRDGEVPILFGKDFKVWTTLFTKELSLIFAYEHKLFLILKLKDVFLRFYVSTVSTYIHCWFLYIDVSP